MSQAIRLGADQAELIAAMEQSYPEEMREGLDRLRYKLGLLEQSEFSFCWGLLDNGKLVAYMLAWPQRSRIDDPDIGNVVYIDDLQVLPGRSDLYRLLKNFALDLEEAQLGHMHIEAVCRRSAYRVLSEHPDVIRRLGYELLGQYDYWEEAVGEEMTWMRWAPTSEFQSGSAATRDLIEVSEDLREELEDRYSY